MLDSKRLLLVNPITTVNGFVEWDIFKKNLSSKNISLDNIFVNVNKKWILPSLDIVYIYVNYNVTLKLWSLVWCHQEKEEILKSDPLWGA